MGTILQGLQEAGVQHSQTIKLPVYSTQPGGGVPEMREASFEALKGLLCSVPTLQSPDIEKAFLLQC